MVDKYSLPRSEDLMSFSTMIKFFLPPKTGGRGKIKEGIKEGGDKLKDGLATHGYVVGYFLCNGLLYLDISIAAAMVISRGNPDHHYIHPCHIDDH